MVEIPVGDLVRDIFREKLGIEVQTYGPLLNPETGQKQIHVDCRFTVPVDVPKQKFASADEFVVAFKQEIDDAAESLAQCLLMHGQRGSP